MPKPPNVLCRALITLILLIQLGLLFRPVDKLANPFRYKERAKAWQTWKLEKTPEAKEQWVKERALLDDHQLKFAGGLLLALLVFDATLIYFFWNYGTKSVVADAR